MTGASYQVRFAAMRWCLPLLSTVCLMAADDGYEEQGRAGFGGFSVPPPLDVLAARDLEPGDGAIVLRVRPGSTAESLGIQPGDIIRTLNGRPVRSFRDVRAIVANVAPGDTATVVVTGADGSTRTITGEFKPRLPRRWGNGPPPWATQGGPPGGWRAPEQLIADQRAALIAEQQRLAAIANDLEQARASLASLTIESEAWVCTIAVHHDDTTPFVAEEILP